MMVYARAIDGKIKQRGIDRKKEFEIGGY